MRRVLVLGLLATTLASQGGTFVSPDGLSNKEGNAYHWAPFSDPQGRFQQIDPSVRKLGPATLKSLAFRRDGTQGGGSSRTVELDLYLGDGQAATYSKSFDANFVAVPTAVFARKFVNLPDWTTPPPTPPATFDLKLTFDQPWAYTATSDPIWDLSCYSSSLSSYALYPVDRAYTLWSYGNTLASGTGCTTGTGVFALSGDVRGSATTMHLGFALSGGPANAPASIAIGNNDVNLSIPGLCANLRPIVLLALPLGTCSATGALPLTTLRAAFDPSMFNVLLITQGFALDTTQTGYPVALTNGLSVLTPNQLGGPLVDAVYTYDTSDPLAQTGSGPHTGGLVVRLGY